MHLDRVISAKKQEISTTTSMMPFFRFDLRNRSLNPFAQYLRFRIKISTGYLINYEFL